MVESENESKLGHGTAKFEQRKFPRFSVDLPIEYSRTDVFVMHGRAINASMGGLLLYLPEQMSIGQHLKLKLFFTAGSKLNFFETVVEVAWTDIKFGEDWGDYRTGVKFIEIAQKDLDKLKGFLNNLLK